MWRLFSAIAMVWALGLCAGCGTQDQPVKTYPAASRASKLPQDIVKRSPQTDQHPPILHNPLFEEPAPLPAPINTAGAEDSPFILPDGQTLYFFFTPDVRIPANLYFVHHFYENNVMIEADLYVAYRK